MGTRSKDAKLKDTVQRDGFVRRLTIEVFSNLRETAKYLQKQH